MAAFTVVLRGSAPRSSFEATEYKDTGSFRITGTRYRRLKACGKGGCGGELLCNGRPRLLEPKAAGNGWRSADWGVCGARAQTDL